MVWVIAFRSPDYFVISPKSLYKQIHFNLSNFVAPGLFLLPRQSFGAVGRRAGALFFARHQDYFIVTRNYAFNYRDMIPSNSFIVTLGFTATYRDWQKLGTATRTATKLNRRAVRLSNN
jgi:hypothetical protein